VFESRDASRDLVRLSTDFDSSQASRRDYSAEFMRSLVPTSLTGFSMASIHRHPVPVSGVELPQTGVTAIYTATDGSGLRIDLSIDRVSEPLSPPDSAHRERRFRLWGHTVQQGERPDHVYAGWQDGDWMFGFSILPTRGGNLAEPRSRVSSLVQEIITWSDRRLAQRGRLETLEGMIRGTVSLGPGDSIGGEGNIDEGRVRALIRAQLRAVLTCYERALPGNPTLSGRLDVRFTVGPMGRVTNASSSGLETAPELGSCVTSRILDLTFPQPEGGSVEFSFPFTCVSSRGA
jgi:hypothetical protein